MVKYNLHMYNTAYGHTLVMQPSTVMAKHLSAHVLEEEYGIASSELLLSLAQVPQAGLQRLLVGQGGTRIAAATLPTGNSAPLLAASRW